MEIEDSIIEICRKNFVTDQDINKLQNLLSQLTSLSLHRDQLSDAGLKALAKALRQNNTLTALGFSGNKIGAVEVRVLAEALKENRTLTYLELGVEEPIIQVYLLRNRFLQDTHFCLRISDLTISKKFLKILFSDIDLSKIRELEVTSCEVKFDSFKFLITHLTFLNQLISFTCYDRGVNDGMVNYLWDYLIAHPHPSLAYIDLSGNPLTNASITKLADLLKVSSKIVKLKLDNYYGRITDVGLAGLGQALQQNKTLRSLHLLGAKVTDTGIESFLDLIFNNFSITDFVYTSPPTYTSFSYNPSYASSKRNYDAMQRKVGRIINRNQKKMISLSAAVNTENMNEMEKLFNIGVSLYAAEETTADTMLHLAVRDRRENVVCYLLSKGFNKYLTNVVGETALDIAKRTRNSKIIALLESDQVPVAPPINDQVGQKETVKKGKRRAVSPPKAKKGIDWYFNKKPREETSERLGVNTSAVISSPEISAPKELSFFMALNGNIGFFTNPNIKLEPYIRYMNEQTLLHAAALYGHYKIVEILMATIPANVTDRIGYTPLHSACLFADRFNTADTIKILVANNATVDSPDICGVTPLYLLAGGFDQNINTNTEADNLRICAKILIEHGADLHHAVYDMELNVANFTVLHKAVSRCSYYLVTAILAKRIFNMGMQDGNGDTVFHWAVRVADINILDRLLIEPSAINICSTIANKAGKTAHALARELATQNNKYKDVVDLLESHIRKIKPSSNSGIYWVKDFSLLYGARYDRNDKSCVIRLNDVHSALAESISRRGDTTKEGHKLAAALTFIVSDKAYIAENYKLEHRRTYITIRLDSGYSIHVSSAWRETEQIGNRKRCPEMKNRILQRLSAIPLDRQQELTDDSNSTNQSLSSKAVEELYTTPAIENKSFEKFFHHSEQALLDFLEDDIAIQEIASKLIQDSWFKSGCKVYAVILSLHSGLYICNNCEVSILGEQNSQQSVFLEKLANSLIKKGCKLPCSNQLRMITCASAINPSCGRTRKMAEDHLALEIDLRRYYGNLILQRDIATTMQSTTIFRSRR